MMDTNRHTLDGHLGDDPRCFNDPGKTEMTAFSLATTLRFHGANGNMLEDTEWHQVVAYGWRALVASEFRKGERVFVEGYVRTTTYEKDGKKNYVKEIVAQSLHAVRARPKAESTNLSQSQPQGEQSGRADPANQQSAPNASIAGAFY